MTVFGRRTCAEINLAAASNNFKQIASLAKNSQVIPVIKADAYGHGSVAIAKRLLKQVSAFAVAFIDEAVHLREHGIMQPILLLEGVMNESEMLIAHELNLWVMVHNKVHLKWLTSLEKSQRPNIWIKVDTGMHRLGIELSEVNSILAEFNELLTNTTVLCSHLSSADEKNSSVNQSQLQQIQMLASSYKLPFSLANSAAILQWPEYHGDWSRLGIALYGSSPVDNKKVKLQPVMTLKAPIIALRTLEKGETVGYGQNWTAKRKSKIATVAIGYGDGYPRHAEDGTPAWLRDQKVSLVGRVSMDMLTLDVTDLPYVELNDVVELWGENVLVEEVSKHASTISYELLTRLSSRVKRIYIT